MFLHLLVGTLSALDFSRPGCERPKLSSNGLKKFGCEWAGSIKNFTKCLSERQNSIDLHFFNSKLLASSQTETAQAMISSHSRLSLE
jgi:hypothetical protein